MQAAQVLWLHMVQGSALIMCSLHVVAAVVVLQVHASLIVVLTRGGSTGRLVAKYRPLVPVLTVAVPVLTTDSLTWTCSNEAPARQVGVPAAGARFRACGTTDVSSSSSSSSSKNSVLQSLTVGCPANPYHAHLQLLHWDELYV